MNRTEKINQILKNRNETAEKVRAAINLLHNVEGALSSCSARLKMITEQLKATSDEEGHQSTAKRLQSELEWTFSTKIISALQEMSVLLSRLKRPTLNIGVTGNAGIGKSTLLQHLTGLSNDIIPARNSDNPMGGSCTGAPSIIINNVNNDRTYADIEFYQETDFFEEIIKPYYRALDHQQCWLPCPARFYDFMNNPLPPLPVECANDNRICNLYDALKYRQTNAKHYQSDFGRTIFQAETDVIRKYVAQKNKDNDPIADWIPVKMVTIYCPFHGKDGTRITDPFSVCDTPGLGDIGCKVDDNLMRNIAENIDAVWMLILVTANSQIIKQTDSDLYMLIREAVPEWQPQEWVYGVINKYTGTTPEQVDVFRTEMKQRHIDLRKVHELDARNRDEALDIFDATLDDVIENQRRLDESLYRTRFEKVRQLLESIRHFAQEQLEPFLKKYANGMMDINTAKAEFEDNIWDPLRNSLTDLKEQYKENSLKKNVELEQCVRELADKKHAPDFLVKPIAVIAVEIKANPLGWLTDEMDRLRVALGKEIGKTGTNLAVLFDKLRLEVCEIFLQTGQLQSLLPEIASPRELLGILAERIRSVPTPKKEIVEDIAQGIETLRGATISYEQLLEPRITQYGCLDCLNINGKGKVISDLFNPSKAKEENRSADNEEERYPGACYARESVRGQIQEALEEVCKRLNESYDIDGVSHCILVEPSAALYSTIEKFYLVMFADKGSRGRWEEFYINFRDEIWGGNQLGIPQSIVRQWNESVGHLLALLNDNNGNAIR